MVGGVNLYTECGGCNRLEEPVSNWDGDLEPPKEWAILVIPGGVGWEDTGSFWWKGEHHYLLCPRCIPEVRNME